MSKGDTYENDILNLVLNNIDAALIGDATGLRGSTTPGSLYVSLHTGDVGEWVDDTDEHAEVVEHSGDVPSPATTAD
jgi:hypothetical protein